MAPTRSFLCTWDATNAILECFENIHLLSSVVEYTDSNGKRRFEMSGSAKCHVISQDQVMIGIIREEAEEYFLGVKTLESAVDMIQNRISTRINE